MKSSNYKGFSFFSPLIEVGDTGKLPSVIIERYNTAGDEGTTFCAIFSRDSAGLGIRGQFSVFCGVSTKGKVGFFITFSHMGSLELKMPFS